MTAFAPETHRDLQLHVPRISRMRRTLVVAIALLAVPAARGDGLPVLNIDVSAKGVAAPGGTVRYVTVTPGDVTVVEAIAKRTGRILHSAYWQGKYTIPAVAYDATAGGLSADRETLVLIAPREGFPRARTQLLVLRTRTFRLVRRIDLAGDFSYDAISPNGSRIYLIQYTSKIDPTRYLVRSFDVRRGRLDTKPIVDPRDATEKMRGNPMSRVTSADGRFAYTLYDGGGLHPFIHALDTRDATARCIDFDVPGGTNLWAARLRLHGSKVVVVYHGAALYTLDTGV